MNRLLNDILTHISVRSKLFPLSLHQPPIHYILLLLDSIGHHIHVQNEKRLGTRRLQEDHYPIVRLIIIELHHPLFIMILKGFQINFSWGLVSESVPDCVVLVPKNIYISHPSKSGKSQDLLELRISRFHVHRAEIEQVDVLVVLVLLRGDADELHIVRGDAVFDLFVRRV